MFGKDHKNHLYYTFLGFAVLYTVGEGGCTVEIHLLESLGQQYNLEIVYAW
jgi:hypothetical protein